MTRWDDPAPVEARPRPQRPERPAARPQRPQPPQRGTWNAPPPASQSRPNVVADVARAGWGGLVRGVTYAANATNDARNLGMNLGAGAVGAGLRAVGQGGVADRAERFTRRVADTAAPSSQTLLTQTVPNTLGANYRAETRPGRYAGTAGEFVGGALAGGGVGGRGVIQVAGNVVKNALLPAVASEGAGEAAQALGGNALAQGAARIVGGVAGGLAGNARLRVQRVPPTPSAADVARSLRNRGGRGAADAEAMRTRALAYKHAEIAPTIVDVTNETGRRTIRAAASRPGPGLDKAREFNTQRNVDVQSRVPAQARRIMAPDDTRTPDQMRTQLTEQRQTQARTDYAEPYRTQVDVPEEIGAMLSDSSGRSIVGRAMADAVENQDWMAQAELQALTRVPINGKLPRVSAGTVDRLVIAARERGTTFAESGRNYRARGAYQRQEQLDGVLADVPELQPARAAYADMSRRIEAVDTGQEFLVGRNPDDFVAATQAMTPEQLRINQASAANRVENVAGASPRSALGVADQLAFGENQGRANTALLGPEGAQNLSRTMDLEASLVRNAQDVNPRTGSGTQLNQANDSRLGQAVEAAPAAVAAVHGNPIPAAALWLRTRGMSDAEAERLVMAAMDPLQTDAVIEAIDALTREPGMGARFIQSIRAPQINAGITSARSAGQGQEPQ